MRNFIIFNATLDTDDFIELQSKLLEEGIKTDSIIHEAEFKKAIDVLVHERVRFEYRPLTRTSAKVFLHKMN